jgi:hypothetical protein
MVLHQPEPETILAGDTFLLLIKGNNHLFVVCSDPAVDNKRIVIVGFTTRTPEEEQCCVIAAGEHDFVKHDTCVRYKDAKVASKAQLLQLLKSPLASRHKPVCAELLARIRAGAAETKCLPEVCREVLTMQGFLTPAPCERATQQPK